jgi:REP element-mobilizing transposase RayT
MTGWVLGESGRLKREIKPHMGRRLRGWDYSKRMIYEITIVLEDRRPILGRVVKESEDQWAFKPSAIGAAILECWREIPTRWPQVELIESQLMPDHFHGILFIKEPLPKGKTLSNIVGSFKSRSASEALKILVARDEARNVVSGNARASV